MGMSHLNGPFASSGHPANLSSSPFLLLRAMSRAGKQWNKSLGGGCPYGRGPLDASPGVLKKSLALAARLVLVSGLKPGQRYASVLRATSRGGIFHANEENHRGNRGGI